MQLLLSLNADPFYTANSNEIPYELATRLKHHEMVESMNGTSSLTLTPSLTHLDIADALMRTQHFVIKPSCLHHQQQHYLRVQSARRH